MSFHMREYLLERPSIAVDHDILQDVRVAAPCGDAVGREVFYLVESAEAIR